VLVGAQNSNPFNSSTSNENNSALTSSSQTSPTSSNPNSSLPPILHTDISSAPLRILTHNNSNDDDFQSDTNSLPAATMPPRATRSASVAEPKPKPKAAGKKGKNASKAKKDNPPAVPSVEDDQAAIAAETIGRLKRKAREHTEILTTQVESYERYHSKASKKSQSAAPEADADAAAVDGAGASASASASASTSATAEASTAASEPEGRPLKRLRVTRQANHDNPEDLSSPTTVLNTFPDFPPGSASNSRAGTPTNLAPRATRKGKASSGLRTKTS